MPYLVVSQPDVISEPGSECGPEGENGTTEEQGPLTTIKLSMQKSRCMMNE